MKLVSITYMLYFHNLLLCVWYLRNVLFFSSSQIVYQCPCSYNTIPRMGMTSLTSYRKAETEQWRPNSQLTIVLHHTSHYCCTLLYIHCWQPEGQRVLALPWPSRAPPFSCGTVRTPYLGIHSLFLTNTHLPISLFFCPALPCQSTEGGSLLFQPPRPCTFALIHLAFRGTFHNQMLFIKL